MAKGPKFRMTKEKWQQIKELISKGVKYETITKLTGFSARTIGYVRASETFEGYCICSKLSRNQKRVNKGETLKEAMQEMEAIKDGINQLRAQLVLGVAAKLDQEEAKVERIIKKLERFANVK